MYFVKLSEQQTLVALSSLSLVVISAFRQANNYLSLNKHIKLDHSIAQNILVILGLTI
jgi:hypothetical protein